MHVFLVICQYDVSLIVIKWIIVIMEIKFIVIMNKTFQFYHAIMQHPSLPDTLILNVPLYLANKSLIWSLSLNF